MASERKVSSPRSFTTIRPLQKESCSGDYKLGGKLGSGGTANVNIGTSPSMGTVALKMTDLLIPIGTDPWKNESYLRQVMDASLLKYLQDEKWLDVHGKMQDLVPRLYDTWTCTGPILSSSKFVVVMDEWNGDMSNLAKKQWTDLPATKHRAILSSLNAVRAAKAAAAGRYGYQRIHTDKILLLTKAQLDNLVRIAGHLDDMGIIHGDLKLDQFLYRFLSPPDDMLMTVTDFGYASDYGWLYNYGCKLGTTIPPALRKEFNLLQLIAGLSQYNIHDRALVISSPSPTSPSRGEAMYSQFDPLAYGIPYSTKLQALRQCSSFPNNIFSQEELIEIENNLAAADIAASSPRSRDVSEVPQFKDIPDRVDQLNAEAIGDLLVRYLT
jgi:serine/threonine protein kinase